MKRLQAVLIRNTHKTTKTRKNTLFYQFLGLRNWAMLEMVRKSTKTFQSSIIAEIY